MKRKQAEGLELHGRVISVALSDDISVWICYSTNLLFFDHFKDAKFPPQKITFSAFHFYDLSLHPRELDWGI